MGFLERLEKLVTGRSHGNPAPNKPLLLLYALGRMVRGEQRLVEYNDAEPLLKALLKDFGAAASQHPQSAYSHLCSDRLWDIPKSIGMRKRSNGDFQIGDLRKDGAGGFPLEIYLELRDDPDLVHLAIQGILDKHFARALHEDLRAAVGVPSGLPYDPHFRLDVLHAYDCRCAICGFDTRIDNRPLGLEAVHIKPSRRGGPDRTSNGIALCALHHKAFDCGAIGLKQERNGFRVMVSEEVVDDGAGPIVDRHGRPVRQPDETEHRPDPEYVEWHTEQIFRKPSRPEAA